MIGRTTWCRLKYRSVGSDQRSDDGAATAARGGDRDLRYAVLLKKVHFSLKAIYWIGLSLPIRATAVEQGW